MLIQSDWMRNKYKDINEFEYYICTTKLFKTDNYTPHHGLAVVSCFMNVARHVSSNQIYHRKAKL